MNHSIESHSRRRFLKQLGYLGVAAPFIHDLGRIAEAADDVGYKALVCIFQSGGNDGHNLLIPSDDAEYNNYKSLRGDLALTKEALLPITPQGSAQAFGLHPSLSELQQLFESGKAALVANVGPLAEPTSKAQYQARSVRLPPYLFSHEDQQVHWQSSLPDKPFATGWGGRVADTLRNVNNSASMPLNVSLSGVSYLQVSNRSAPFQMSTAGAPALQIASSSTQLEVSTAFLQVLRNPHDNILERGWAEQMDLALRTRENVATALTVIPAPTTVFPNSSLGNQLRMAARLIAARNALGMQRQIIFCDVGGWDTHSNQLTFHANLLRDLSQSLRAFYAATVELGVAADVTAFTASDFGRTITSNGGGSDHGWGGHHIVVGGSVAGRRLYGQFPTLANNGPDDVGYGRLIPTTSVDQYAATLAKWFGVSGSALGKDVFPNLSRFNSSDLGFMG